MTTLSILLQQIKEKEERDLAYAKKIKEAETLLKAEQETLKKFKNGQNMLLEGIKRKSIRCSRKEITKIMLQHEKKIWEDLLKEAQKDLREKEAKLDELQQSVCLNRLKFYNDIKVFLDKHELMNSSNAYNNKSTSPALVGTQIKIEQDEDDYGNLMEEIETLENQLEEVRAEEIQIEEAKRLKVQLEAEPSCGEEFLRNQKMLKETKDNLKIAEEEVIRLKMEIAQKDLLILKKRSTATEVKPGGSQVGFEENPSDMHHQENKTLDVTKSTRTQGNSKAVTFESGVEMKNISSPLHYKCPTKFKNKTKSPSPALRKKLAQQITSQLDETMRNILFKDKM